MVGEMVASYCGDPSPSGKDAEGCPSSRKDILQRFRQSVSDSVYDVEVYAARDGLIPLIG